MKKLKYIFIGGKTLGYETLSFLLRKKFIPECVVPNVDDYGKDNLFTKSLVKLAKKNKLKIISIKNLSKYIKKKNIVIDVIFCLGSTSILPQDIIDLPLNGCLNIHPSILPNYRGRYSLVHAIFNGDKFTGLTIHWIGKKIDSGKILFQKKLKILDSDTGKTLYDKFTNSAIIEFKKIFFKIINKKPINSYKIKKINKKYKNKHFPNDGNINWNWKGIQIYNFLRSMIHEPFNPPKFLIGKESYYVVSKKLLKKNKLLKSPK